MSVVRKEYCKNFIYPTPFELHFSNMWLEKYLLDPRAFCEAMNGIDSDLAAHFTVIKHVGVVLCGAAINKVFGEVNKEYYISSIKGDIENAKDEIFKNPMYYVLNLCRVLAYLKDDIVISKKEGGEWGLINLSDEYCSIVEKAIHCYCGNELMTLDNNKGMDFCEYMLNEINSKVKLA
jgi:streptomycin 3"-adenylyltransferase